MPFDQSQDYLVTPMRTLLTALAFLTAFTLGAQRVYVTSTATDTVRQGSIFDITFGFENVSAADFELPELVGLKVVGGPSRRSQMSIINGQRSSSEAIVYRVVADQSGLAYIPAVEGKARDKMYSSEPLKLFVTADPSYVAPQTAVDTPPAPPSARRRPTVKM